MKMRTFIALCAKASVTGLLFWIIFRRIDLSAVGASLSHITWIFLLPVAGLAAVLLLSAVQRWRSVAATFDQDVTLRQGLAYSFISLLFDNALPTGFGADAFRTWRLYRDGMRMGLAARIVITDRLCAFTLLIVIIGLGLPQLLSVPGEPLFKYVAPLVFGTGASGLILFMALPLVENHLPNIRFTRLLTQQSHDLSRALFGASYSPSAVFWAACVHLCRIGIVQLLAFGLGLNISPLDVFALAPASFLIAMVPISLAGWGVREVVFINAFSLAGLSSADALALSILFGLVWLVMGLIGGLVWVAEIRSVVAPRVKCPSKTLTERSTNRIND